MVETRKSETTTGGKIFSLKAQDASATAKTSTGGWSVKAWRSPIVSIPPSTLRMKPRHAKREKACGERNSICLGIGGKAHAARKPPPKLQRSCATSLSDPIPAVLDGPVRRSGAARKRSGIWKTAPGAAALIATTMVFPARASARGSKSSDVRGILTWQPQAGGDRDPINSSTYSQNSS